MSYMSSVKKRVYKAAKSVVQHLVKAEAQDWPPYTMCGLYQPRRPNMTQSSAQKTEKRESEKENLWPLTVRSKNKFHSGADQLNLDILELNYKWERRACHLFVRRTLRFSYISSTFDSEKVQQSTIFCLARNSLPSLCIGTALRFALWAI